MSILNRRPAGPVKSTRKTRREQREAANWARRWAEAGDDPAAQAVVVFDQIRAGIKALKPAQRSAAWRTVRAGLEDLRRDIQPTQQ
ncbi:hypothetical protein ABZ671_18465 [Micromonospora sp. NPDC006766]|uniref:hypothetical protein n=1 Tax=Micromonospora sp. NPDC006766 TaxID=3154778 RepID=UPI0033F3868A